MPKIKPFCALFYNQEKINDVSKVVCPPYDIIDSTRQEYYHSLSSHNLIHLTLGKDSPDQDKYKRAGKYFNQWIREQILIADATPGIYFYLQQYSLERETKKRLGFIALMQLDEKGMVFPHEHTRMEAKQDRLKLLRAVKANLSPIFVLFKDKKRILARVYEQYISKKEPFIKLTDSDMVLHKVWKIDDPHFLNLIQNQIGERNIFIADGHHRYEVAAMYRDKIKKRLRRQRQERDYNYIMAYFTNVESRGLVILPVHRLVKKVKLTAFELRSKLEQYFDVEEAKDKVQLFFLMKKSGLRQPTLGLYQERRYFLLRLKSIKTLDKMISDRPKEYRRLEVAILNYIILKTVLKKDPEDKTKVIFNNNAQELIRQANSEEGAIVFFVNPVRPEQMVLVASKGERLPPKSTYFYPKVLSGLVINKFKENKR